MSFYDSLEAGSQVDSYRIDAPIARSGMASIYRAIDVRDNRIVALKIPHPDMEADPILSDRFNREGGIGERLNHPNVMRVFGDDKRSRVYMVMEWCPGRLLRQIMDEERLPHDRAIRIAELYPRQWRRPSRPEAGKYHGRRARPHQAHRFRHRQRLLRAASHLR
jgi:serine/threonine protein kinase